MDVYSINKKSDPNPPLKIITFYKKTPYALRSQIELKLEKMKPAQLTTTINMLSNETNALIPQSVVKRLLGVLKCLLKQMPPA